MVELIRELFELWVKKNWLNHINRMANKYNMLNQKAREQGYVLHKLVERYNEIYPNDRIEVK